MTLTKNLVYQGPDGPHGTVVPREMNVGIQIRTLPAMADVADLLTAGVICMLTATTNESDMTPATAALGKDAREGDLFVVEIVHHDPYFATTTDIMVFPNKVPNSSITLADYTHAANTHIRVIPLEIGMKLWVLGSNDATFDTTYGYEYIIAANGLITAVADIDGVVIDQVAHTFKSLATTLNQNWALVEYMGKHAHDKST